MIQQFNQLHTEIEHDDNSSEKNQMIPLTAKKVPPHEVA